MPAAAAAVVDCAVGGETLLAWLLFPAFSFLHRNYSLSTHISYLLYYAAAVLLTLKRENYTTAKLFRQDIGLQKKKVCRKKWESTWDGWNMFRLYFLNYWAAFTIFSFHESNSSKAEIDNDIIFSIMGVPYQLFFSRRHSRCRLPVWGKTTSTFFMLKIWLHYCQGVKFKLNKMFVYKRSSCIFWTI